MTLFQKYKNEDEFRELFVRPLLNRLGYLRATEKHGRNEFGKDFVFSEVDRFGVTRHYCTQVKHLKKVNQGAIVDGLCSQIEQCFSIPFTLGDSIRECYVSAVYVLSSGEITDNAITQMQGKLRRTNYGDNVFFLEGTRLESMAKWGAFQHDRQFRERLQGLSLQLRLNIAIWQEMKLELPKMNVHLTGSLTCAVEEWLTVPFVPNRIDPNLILDLWQRIKQIDATCLRLRTAVMSQELMILDAKKVVEIFIPSAVRSSEKVIAEIDLILAEFGAF